MRDMQITMTIPEGYDKQQVLDIVNPIISICADLLQADRMVVLMTEKLMRDI